MPSISVSAPSGAAEGAEGSKTKVGFGEMFRTADGRSYALPFALVSSLFALWGFCNGLLDILNKHFKDALSLSHFQSQFVQSANFMGYFVMALPAGMLARRFGYKGGILIGLGLIAAGAFWFIPATAIGTYWAFLMGLFILASGLACLETVANPYTTVLGPPRGAAARINLAQSCNGIGAMLGPIVGGSVIFSASAGGAAGATSGHDRLYIPYLGIGLVVAVLVVLFAVARLPDIEQDDASKSGGSLWSRPHFSLAVMAQFLYVGAQVCIFSNFLTYLTEATPKLSAAMAASLPAGWTTGSGDAFALSGAGGKWLLSAGLGLFLLGRISGSFALRVWKAHTMLGLYCVINAGLLALSVLPLGWLSMGALLLSFFFMSIMFPTIFSLGIDGLGPQTKRASAFIVMSIVGGALIPLPMGRLADLVSVRVSFLVPLLCFAGMLIYAFSFEKLRARSQVA
jgi:MFS transporter, FHS family, L-fucose permease